jgi:lysophospholipase L1-like esterase
VAGWRRMPRRATIKLLAAGLVTAEAINLGAIMIAGYSAPTALRQVRSLNELVGSAAHLPRTVPKGRPLPAVQVVAMGDSTAAGAGLPRAAGASRADKACGRSTDAYPADLAAANGWNVLNLACNGATIRHGLLGSQDRRGERLPPQLDIAQQARRASAVIVSVGADDLNWAVTLHYCAAAPRCDDRATTAYFQQQLASFSKDYLELLSRLAALPAHPRVIINQYYDPFGLQPGCLSGTGLTTAKLATLTSRLATLNTVLAKGAAQFGFSSPQPQFTGHQLCNQLPYVQGPGSAAPFHPTGTGQLAIALADQAVLQTHNARQTAEPAPGGGQLAQPRPQPSRESSREPGRALQGLYQPTARTASTVTTAAATVATAGGTAAVGWGAAGGMPRAGSPGRPGPGPRRRR